MEAAEPLEPEEAEEEAKDEKEDARDAELAWEEEQARLWQEEARNQAVLALLADSPFHQDDLQVLTKQAKDNLEAAEQQLYRQPPARRRSRRRRLD